MAELRENHCIDYAGIFKPTRTDNLREGLDKLIGKKFIFHYLWTNGTDESNYPGSRCYEIVHEYPNLYRYDNEKELRESLGVKYIGWIPECDIEWM